MKWLFAILSFNILVFKHWRRDLLSHFTRHINHFILVGWQRCVTCCMWFEIWPLIVTVRSWTTTSKWCLAWRFTEARYKFCFRCWNYFPGRFLMLVSNWNCSTAFQLGLNPFISILCSSPQFHGSMELSTPVSLPTIFIEYHMWVLNCVLRLILVVHGNLW